MAQDFSTALSVKAPERRTPVWRAIVLAVAGVGVGLTSFGISAVQAGGEREPGGATADSCIGCEHRDFKGMSRPEQAGRGYNYVGDRMNDKISSFRIASGCHVTAYQHRDYQGDSTVFEGDYRYVGDLWNDQISSFKCNCN